MYKLLIWYLSEMMKGRIELKEEKKMVCIFCFVQCVARETEREQAEGKCQLCFSKFVISIKTNLMVFLCLCVCSLFEELVMPTDFLCKIENILWQFFIADWTCESLLSKCWLCDFYKLFYFMFGGFFYSKTPVFACVKCYEITLFCLFTANFLVSLFSLSISQPIGWMAEEIFLLGKNMDE